ncbi:DUF2142 domain-containing protein [Pantoea sp.]|uniref:DUF2142 domain-containing protein n=1 Tax=Pantoea sp. TaxID=69393 RepID=UPI0028963EFA|nr:DUF2142 domain-containing protein [Pantoea sp.]
MFTTRSYNFVLSTLVLIIAFLIVLSVKPPFSSPDEAHHLMRADGILNGYFLLKPINEKGTSGAYINSTLATAEDIYNELSEDSQASSTIAGINKMKNLHWSPYNIPEAMPNVTFYDPLVYFPQAISFYIGKLFNLSFFYNYIITNTLTFACCLLLLLLAYKIYPIPPLALFFIFIPMSLIQLMSPTIDGLNISMTALIMSIFVKCLQDSDYKHYISLTFIMSVLIFCTAGSKANLLFFMFLPFWLYLKYRKKSDFLSFITVVLLTLGWTVFNIINVNDAAKGRHPGYTNAELIVFYIEHPFVMLNIFLNTLKDTELVRFYYHSFIGILGHLDAPIKSWQRNIFVIYFFIFISAHLKNKHKLFFSRSTIFIILIALLSALLIFPALLVQWTKFPTTIVDGIQGRYFIIPAVVISYAFNLNKKLGKKLYIVIFFTLITSVYSIYDSLKMRYYDPSISYPANEDLNLVGKAYNLDINSDYTYYINVPEGKIKTIAIFMANYNYQSKGKAVLKACNEKDCTTSQIDISQLDDNSFYSFNLSKSIISSNNKLNITLSFQKENGSLPLALWLYENKKHPGNFSPKTKIYY